MKKILLSIAILSVFSLCANAQENTSDTAKNSSESKILVDGKPRKFIFNWSKSNTEIFSYSTGLGIAASFLTGTDFDYNGASFFANMIGYNKAFNSHFLFAVGGGFNIYYYQLKDDMYLGKENGIMKIMHEPEKNIGRSEFMSAYLTVPLLFEYQIKSKRGLTYFISASVEQMIKFFSTSITERYYDNEHKTETNYYNMKMSWINARFLLRAGYFFKDRFIVSVIGFYQPFSLFRSGKGPNVKPYGFAVAFDIGLYNENIAKNNLIY
jgi:hypothetical protein